MGSATSKAGLWNSVAEREPQILLIDELDKMSATDTAVLLSLMEGGGLVLPALFLILKMIGRIFCRNDRGRVDSVRRCYFASSLEDGRKGLSSCTAA